MVRACFNAFFVTKIEALQKLGFGGVPGAKYADRSTGETMMRLSLPGKAGLRISVEQKKTAN